MTTNINGIIESMPMLNAESWIDLRQYNPSQHDRGRSSLIVILWWLLQGILFPLSLHNFNSFRAWLLRLFGAKIGRGVVIRPSARFIYPWKIAIGDYSWIGDDVVLYSVDRIEIGCHCVVSQKSYLCTGSHDITDRAFGLITAPVLIGNGTWIASDCFIAPGVAIGANSVIGARSSVFRNIPAEQIAWGTPCVVHQARIIKQ
ncbi:colanic acid biosynthesis acetyltransferase WcaF [Waterburya agarophytonicola K14]|uniref:Colanic acid biosynthesis acetyltransferase WcaF n=1 Tax=Waterburya agarophytonicola KI4 TaxID=2874699 RepID=A0A964BN89_9CYAN|nr:hormogonium polysaccharide biosynthesis acetyltransferase HpsU [Waterburya agarophytonicola]MCC0175731.1 colanic acid biosynthesis acetyltransferase WcaF [Waterburya agarophytonicola KI4]